MIASCPLSQPAGLAPSLGLSQKESPTTERFLFEQALNQSKPATPKHGVVSWGARRRTEVLRTSIGGHCPTPLEISGPCSGLLFVGSCRNRLRCFFWRPKISTTVQRELVHTSPLHMLKEFPFVKWGALASAALCHQPAIRNCNVIGQELLQSA